MSSLRWWCAALLAVVVVIQKVRGHGRLWEPPGRSTMWRRKFPTPPNYDDTGLNCGGRDHQWNVNGGMCGVCGDPWDKPPPRDNEDGGKYGTGIITRTYTPGQDIAVQLEITANHLGWFEFRICPQNDPKIPVTQECLDEYLLQLSDGSGTRFNLGPGMQIVEYNVRLPRDLTCSKCVVQWKWRAGNNYGEMHQEEFYACSDVAIGTPATTGPATNTPRPSVSTPPSFHPVTQTIRPPPGTPTHQLTGTPTHSPLTTTMQATSQTTLTSPTTVLLTPPPVTIHPASLPVTTSGLHCYAVGSWAGNEDLDRWCQQACTTSLACDPQFCHCEERTVTQQSMHTTTHALMTNTPIQPLTTPTQTSTTFTTLKTVPTTTVPLSSQPQTHCFAIGSWAGNEDLDRWCQQACTTSLACDPQFCHCEERTVTQQSMHTTTHALMTNTPIQPLTTPTQTSTTFTTLKTVPTTTVPLSSQPQTHCFAIGSWAGNEDLDRWCQQACTTSLACDPQFCHCEERTVTQQSMHTTTHALMTNTPIQPLTTPTQTSTTFTTLKTVPTTTVPLSSQPQTHCFAIGAWAGSENLDAWCQQTCTTSPSACDPRYCHCEERTVTQQSMHTTTHALMTNTPIQPLTTPTQTSTTFTTLKTVPTTTVPLSSQPQTHCFAIGSWAGNEDLDRWCQQACTTSLACDPQFCHCEERTVTQQSMHTTTHALMTNTPIQPLTTPTQTSTTFTTLKTVPTTTVPLSSQPQTHCFAIGSWAGNEDLDRWCQQACTTSLACDPQFCHCEERTVTQQSMHTTTHALMTNTPIQPLTTLTQTSTTFTTLKTVPTTTVPLSSQPQTHCFAIGAWAGSENLDAWCQQTCTTSPSACDPQYCQCEERTVTQQSIHTTTHALTTNTPFQPLTNPTQTSTASTTLKTVPTTTVLPGGVSQTHCFAVGGWAGMENLDRWCEQTCTNVACDPQYCQCEQSPHIQQVTSPTYQAQTVTLMPTTRQPPPPTQSVMQTLPTSTSSPTTTTVQLTTPATESPRQQCRAVGSWAGQPQMDSWCTEACAGRECDPQLCSCDQSTQITHHDTSPITHTPTYQAYQPITNPTEVPRQTSSSVLQGGSPLRCHGVGPWEGITNLDIWCTEACANVGCDAAYCSCH